MEFRENRLSKTKKLSFGTVAKVDINIQVSDYNAKDQKEVWDFFKECSDIFHLCRIPCVVGENKEQ